jgi:predicted short-subunit dehydrogenase-like oxidoreductase (DUF2520 family)
MQRIFIIGTGQLGTQLAQHIEAQDPTILKLVGYSNKSATKLDQIQAPLMPNTLPECDIIILAVPDDRVRQISDQLGDVNAIVAHTSGSIPLAALQSHPNHGVYYMPQSFSKSRPVDFDQLPVCLEASNDATMEQLRFLGSTLSRKLTTINSSQRQQLHVAAVFINNFVNHCYTKAGEIAMASGLDFELLHPLMEETLAKALSIGASNAQTGPAMREDIQTINKHLELLSPSDGEMYRAITQSIKTTYGKKL